MKTNQIIEVFSKLDSKKRIKFQNSSGLGRCSVAITHNGNLLRNVADLC